MTRFIESTQANCEAYYGAIDTAAGCPYRAVRCVQVDRAGVAREILPYPLPLVYQGPSTPGWTDHICIPPVVESPGRAALEVHTEAEQYLGRTVGPVTLPAVAALKLENDLHPQLRTKVRESKGLDASGNPLPFPGAPGQGQGQAAGKAVKLK